MRIAVDVQGGDNAPLETVRGCALAKEKYGAQLILCGEREEILKAMADSGIAADEFTIAGTTQSIGYDEEPAVAIRSKADSPIVVGLNMLKDGQADAFVSAGNTGALLIGSTLIVKRIKGIKRAAFAPLLPTGREKGTMLIDAGANVDGKPEHLLQFGIMGSAYMKGVEGVECPSVGLLNNGAEETKGTELHRKAHALMKEAGINFVGNIEGREVASGAVDVIVSDGFTGNIFLKTFEGVGMTMYEMIKQVFMKGPLTKIAALLVKSGLKSFKKKMDYTEYGGAILMGIAKPVIKAHGSSNAKAFCSAIGQAARFVECGLIATIEGELEKNAELYGESAE